MKITEVNVNFNGATMKYLFMVEKDEFIKTWDNHIGGIGHFQFPGYVDFIDENHETLIIINPSQCGSIEIHETDEENKYF